MKEQLLEVASAATLCNVAASYTWQSQQQASSRPTPASKRIATHESHHTEHKAKKSERQGGNKAQAVVERCLATAEKLPSTVEFF